MSVLTGQTAFITGATGAIATASAIAMARDGARLALMARREEGLAATRAAIVATVPEADILTITGDCADEAAVKQALIQAQGWAGQLDILFATVGSGDFTPLMMLDADALRRTVEINLMTAFFVVRHGVPLMRPGGSIICTSSSSAPLTFPYLSAYHIAKGAVEALVRAAADELGSAGIRINAVRPGLTRAESTGALFTTPGSADQFLPEYPLGRLGEPEDIAEVVRFLAGPGSRWMTGECLSVDGGNHLRRSPDLTPMVEAMHGKDRIAAIRSGKEIEA
ncbi:SDR family NAD(P)-dependent oxidoreductase [Sphingobium estronivorans]|uniref:SDR family NAD(P)-dependent oxidoreductase n=1 Tax=Sphingobium estronivorans TaxID=1577690 RepID=UPI00123B6F29|nr:SDR family oxidoreductase [Sphingobium estronivorans]